MGQRLTFKIIKGGECIASIYYHWSAYTGETYLEALKLIYGLRMRGYTKECSNDDTIILLEDILECNCIILHRGTDMEKVEIGGVDVNCDIEFSEIYKKKYGIDFRYCAHTSRNCGILAIGDHIKTQEYWAEELEEFIDRLTPEQVAALYRLLSSIQGLGQAEVPGGTSNQTTS